MEASASRCSPPLHGRLRPCPRAAEGCRVAACSHAGRRTRAETGRASRPDTRPAGARDGSRATKSRKVPRRLDAPRADTFGLFRGPDRRPNGVFAIARRVGAPRRRPPGAPERRAGENRRFHRAKSGVSTCDTRARNPARPRKALGAKLGNLRGLDSCGASVKRKAEHPMVSQLFRAVQSPGSALGRFSRMLLR